jgi:hypothetical protein
MDRIVQPVCGFQWGFLMGAGGVSIVPPSPLELTEWRNHLGQLRASFKTWQFEQAAAP